jgi:hypothetical protein
MNKNLFLVLFGLCLMSIGAYMFLSIQRNVEIDRIKTENTILQRRVDSLTSEIFVRDITISSYDYALTLLEQSDSNLYKKVMHETE